MKSTKRVPTCDICDKRFKTNQGLGGHRVLYHRSDNIGEPDRTAILNIEANLNNLANRLASIEKEVKDLRFEMSREEEWPIGLTALAVCMKCGVVIQYDKTFQRGGILFEEDHFECPKCGSVKEVVEVLSRDKVSAKEWGKETKDGEYSKEK